MKPFSLSVLLTLLRKQREDYPLFQSVDTTTTLGIFCWLIAHSSPATATSYALVTEWGSLGSGDGQFNTPSDVAVDSANIVYVVDSNNNRIQVFDSSGGYVTQWGSFGASDGKFNAPYSIATGPTIFVLDTNNHRIQVFDYSYTYLSQWGGFGSDNGKLYGPFGLDAKSPDLYVADSFNDRVQKFDFLGNYVTKWGSSGSGNGQFSRPYDIAIDYSGNVYVTDYLNNRVQKFDSSGSYLTQWGSSGTGDGQFNRPTGIAAGNNDNLYVLDTNNHRIQEFDSSGNYITQWGNFGADGGQFNAPTGIAVDNNNNIYIADTNNHRIQKFAPALELTLAVIPVGTGTVSSSGSPMGIPCGTDCFAYSNTTAVTLNATPNPGFALSSWDCTPTFSSGSTLTADTLCTATFSPAFNLTLATVGTGTVSSSGSPMGTPCGTDCFAYSNTTAVTLNATPSPGFALSNWNCTPTFDSGGILTADTLCTATFSQAFNLILATNPIGTGTVSSSGSPMGTPCGTDCLTYLDTTVVTLNATPDTSPLFNGWSCQPPFISGNALTADTICTATFNVFNTPGYSSKPFPNSTMSVGTTLVNTDITATDLTIIEAGDATLSVGSPRFSGEHASDFKLANTLFPLNLPDDGSQVTVPITCTPSATGIRTATLELTSNDPYYSTITYSLTCRGILPVYQSTPVPNMPINVGTAWVGSSTSGSFTVTEQGVGDLTIIASEPSITGTNASDFAILTPLFPFTITDNSNEVKTVRIRCIPSEAGLRTAVLELKSNDPENSKLTYPLECTGRALTAGYVATLPTGKILSTGETLDFENLPVGTTGYRSFSISENGNATLTVEQPSFSSNSEGTFEILNPSFPISLKNDANPISVTVQCKPSTVGIHYAQLKFGTNDPSNRTLTYTLVCTGEDTTSPVTDTPPYESIPSPGETLTFSSSTHYNAYLTIAETDTLPIEERVNIINGSGNFSIIPSTTTPTPEGGVSLKTITLNCTPDHTGKISTATLELTTNDVAYSYPLICAGIHHNHKQAEIRLSDTTIKQTDSQGTVISQLDTIDSEIERFRTTNGDSLCASCHAPTDLVSHYTYTLEDASGLFKIVGNQLILAKPLPSPPQATDYLVVIRSTNSAGIVLTQSFTLQVSTEVFRPIYSSVPAPNGLIQFSFTILETPILSDLEISNIGNQALKVNFEGITGEQRDNFSLATSISSWDLAPDSTQKIPLRCTPPESGLSMATLVLGSTDEQMSLPMYELLCIPEKSGQPAFLSLPPPASTLNFGSSPLAQPIKTALHIIEAGDETLKVKAKITGIDEAYFSVSENDFSVENGQQPHVLEIHCIPKGVGRHFAQLVLSTNDPTQSTVNYELTTCSGERTGSSDYPIYDISLTPQKMNENAPGDTFIGRLTTLGTEEELYKYLLVDDPQGPFAVIGDGLYTASDAVFDSATQSSYPIAIRSIDSNGEFFTKDFTISVNTATKAKIYGNIVTEFGEQGSYVTIDAPEYITALVIIEPPPEQIGRMADIAMTARWIPLGRMEPITIKRPIQRKQLQEHLELVLYQGNLLGASGTFHVDVSYQLDHGIEDSATNIATLQVRRNNPPTAIALSANHVGGNSPPETVVGILSTTDPDKSERFTYIVMDSKYFMAVGNELRRAYSFPPRFAMTDHIPITIRSVDTGSNFTEEQFTIFVDQ